jgi:hypothetical protein
VVTALNNNAAATKHDPTKMPDVSLGVPMHVLNYWKDTLCVNSAEGFEYFKTFETRVPLFAEMIWPRGPEFSVASTSHWPYGTYRDPLASGYS